MALTPEQLAELVTVFRKENEDLTLSLVKDMFRIQYGESSLSEDETKTVTLSENYLSSTDYEVKIFDALDSDGTNVYDSIVISDKQVGSFKIYSPRASVVRWQTCRRTPLINLWTA